MKISRSLFLRVGLMAIALALVAVMVGRNQSPAEATTFNPLNTVSVSDPTPGANADLIINFSVDYPDAFPNTTDHSSTQFIPKQWGINTDAPLGAIGGTFNAISTIGILNAAPCIFPTNVPFTMFNATVDTSNLASELDVDPSHPGGVGFSGQFIEDPDSPEGFVGGITRYPDFLVEMFPDAQPLVRLFGARRVIIAVVSLNLVTFEPGSLPGFPASMGYPTVTVLLDPVSQPELNQNAVTNVTCTPLALTNTTFGVTQDNPDTAADEGGFSALTNPHGQKDHVFTLVAQSDYDADDDGIENWLDACDVNANTINGVLGVDDGRQILSGLPGDDDFYPQNPGIGNVGDGLNEACDPDPATGILSLLGVPDQDGDNYPNVADTCPLDPNGWATVLGFASAPTGGYGSFQWAVVTDPIGPGGPIDPAEVQADRDHDRIGDICDPDPDAPTGHTHVVSLERTVSIFKHGVKLNNLGGPKNVNDGGARDYSVNVSSISDTSEDIQVALRVAEGCASVNGGGSSDTAVVSVGPEGDGSAIFTVDWTGCAAGDYTVQADACHAGDAAPAGFFGGGACPGASDGNADNNALDDAPRSKVVSVGSP